MNKWIKICLAEIILLVAVLLCFRPVLGRFNIYDEKSSQDHNIIHVRMLDEPDKRSYGNEMRILYVKVNGRDLNLSDYDTEDWVWHGEWGYTLFTTGNHDFYIDIDEKINSMDFCYIRQEGSGKCEIYLNDRLLKKQDMFSSKWKNGNLFVSFLNEGAMIFRGIEIWILLSGVLFALYRSIVLWKKPQEGAEIRIGLGTFNIAKGLGIVLVVLIHSGLCVLTDADLLSGSLIVGALFVFFTYGLMPAFFILGGFGRKAKITAAGILNNLKEMLVPYVVIAAIIMICNTIKAYLAADYGFTDLKKDGISLAVMLIHDKDIKGEFYRTIGPLWFTTSFAIGSILVSFILKAKGFLKYVVPIAVTAATWFLMSKDFAYFCITTGMMAALYMYVGNWIYKEKFFGDNKFVRAAVPVMIPIVILAALANGTSFAVSGNNMGNSFILGLIVSIAAAYIYIRVGIGLNDTFLSKVKIFGKIGWYSYHIFFAHALEYMIIPWNKLAEVLPDITALKIIIIFVLRCGVMAAFTAIFVALSRRKIRRKVNARG